MGIKTFGFIFLLVAISACGDSADNSIKASDVRKASENKETPPVNTSNFITNSANVTLLVNANIYTVNTEQPKAQAIAMQAGKIIAIGSDDKLKAAYQDAHIQRMYGATIVPGFIDAHGHLLGLGQSLQNVNLVGTENKAEVLQRLTEREQSLDDGEWLIGFGWDQNDWPEKELPSKADLDSTFPKRPVWLTRIDGHAGWANSAAMALVGKDLDGDWQLEGGEIVRDADQRATGVFIDKAESLIEEKVPAATDEQVRKALKIAMQKTASVGLTGMHDAGTSLKIWQLLQELKAKGQLGIRVYAMANGADDMLDYLCENGQQIDESAMLTARAIKLYSDGALGSRGAALLDDYSDDAGNRGLLIEGEETLIEYANTAANCGLQVNIHAIGDRGNRVTLNALAQASKATNNSGRHRIEHSQVIAADDFQRFKSLKLIASVQPTHATSDMYWAEQRLGSERIKGAYAWQKFRSLGIPIALGSDFPIEQPNPLHGFYAAITRKDHKGWPELGWYPKESLSREEALHGFTLGAAYAAFQEHQVGSIEVGKHADFTVLSRDIMQIPATQILNTSVIATYINGREVFSSPQ